MLHMWKKIILDYETGCNYQITVDKIDNESLHCRNNSATSCLFCSIISSKKLRYAKYRKCEGKCGHIMDNNIITKEQINVRDFLKS